MSRYYANNPDEPISHDWTGAAHGTAVPGYELDAIPLTKEVSRYMATIGRKGGLKRKLTTEEAKAMAALSVAKRREQKESRNEKD